MHPRFPAQRYFPWLMLGLLACNLSLIQRVQAGSVPGGGASGGTTTGSGPLTIGGSPITPESTTSTSPNVSLDPATGNLQLTLAAQQSVNRVAQQLLQQLAATNPGLIETLGEPFLVDPDRQFDTLALAVRGINDGEPVPKSTLGEAAIDAQFGVAELLRWAILYADQNVLELTAPLVVLGSPEQFSMVAVFNPDDDLVTSRLPLQGTLDQLGNATAFLVLTAGSGVPPDAVAPFVDMALAGAPYAELVELLNGVNALVVATAAGEDIDPNVLNRTIYAYRDIVQTVDQPTLDNLTSNAEFLALGQALQQLRSAI